MYPSVGKVYLDSVDVVNALVAEGILHAGKDSIHIHLGFEVDTVFGDAVVGERFSQLTYSAVFLGERAKEESYTDESVSAVMRCGIDDSTITFVSSVPRH